MLKIFREIKNILPSSSNHLKRQKINSKLNFSQKSEENFFDYKAKDKHIYITTDRYSVQPNKEIFFSNSKNFKEYRKKHKTHYLDFFHIKEIGLSAFLPRDYPDSVKEGYYHFSKYAFISGTCYHLMTFISTQVLINSLGLNVNKNTSMAVSAGFNWVIKDCIGQMGSIFFNGKYSFAIEKDLKKWRLYSIAMFNISVFLDICTMLAPHYFIYIASVSNIIRLCAFVANASSRIGINNHFGLRNNITDLSNKFQAQNNLSFVIANITGIAISMTIGLNFERVLLLICGLTVFHLYTAYLSNLKINLNVLNHQKAYIIGEEYLKTGKIIDVITANSLETLWFNKLKFINFSNTNFDALLINEKNNDYINNALTLFRENKFFVYVKSKYSRWKNKYIFTIYSFMRMDAENIDIFIAFLFTLRLNFILNSATSSINKLNSKDVDIFIAGVMEECLKYFKTKSKKDIESQLIDQGWGTNFSLLETQYIRYNVLTR